MFAHSGRGSVDLVGLEVGEFVFEDLVVVVFEGVLLVQLLDLLGGFF
jgi:hypothetical protein